MASKWTFWYEVHLDHFRMIMLTYCSYTSNELYDTAYCQASSGTTGSLILSDLVLHYDPFFLTRTESVSNPLPRSVIVQSLVDLLGNLPERDLCPVRAVRYLRQATRSVEFTPSRLLVSPSDHTRSVSKYDMSFSFAN